MIEVKATREPSAPQPRDRFAFADGEKLSKLPLYFAMFVMSVGAYLKSGFPALALPAALDEEHELPEDEAAAPVVRPIQKTPKQADNDDPAAQEAPPEARGNVVRLPSRPYTLADSPLLEFPSEPEQAQPSIPRLSARTPVPGNDNQSLSSGSGSGSQQSSAAPAQSGPQPAIADLPEGAPSEQAPSEPRRNRAPMVSGRVQLNDVMAGQVVLIGLSELLLNASDPDGDPLTVSNVRVSTGNIGRSADGWVYSSNGQTPFGEVTLTYDVSDGVNTTVHTAVFDIAGRMPIIGTSSDDAIIGSDDADAIDAIAGDDNIDARGGDDTVLGGAGDDHILAGAGNDTIRAGAGNDVVFGGFGDDLISGGLGADRLYGDAGNDTIYGDEGNDLVSGGLGSDVLFGGTGDDHILGGDGDDIISGGAGHDRIEDGNGSDVVQADAGADTVLVAVDGAADFFDGGDGVDTLDFSDATDGVDVDLAAETASSASTGNDSVIAFEVVVGGSGNDSMRAGNTAVTFRGAEGNDSFSDGAGRDVVEGGAGSDVVAVTIDGSNDQFHGGDGNDTLDLSITAHGVTIDFSVGTAISGETGEDSVSGFEVVIGGSGNDSMTAGDTAVTFLGEDGNDSFSDGACSDVVEGGAGSDFILVMIDGSNDRFHGGDGNDTLDFSLTSNGVTVDLVAGTASSGETGEDSLTSLETVIGGSGNDRFQVGDTSVTLIGGAGDDTFVFAISQESELSSELVHQILDFMVGDSLRVAEYEFAREAHDTSEDRFGRIYNKHADDIDDIDIRIRYRNEDTGDFSVAVVEMDRDRDSSYEFSVEIYGQQPVYPEYHANV